MLNGSKTSSSIWPILYNLIKGEVISCPTSEQWTWESSHFHGYDNTNLDHIYEVQSPTCHVIKNKICFPKCPWTWNLISIKHKSSRIWIHTTSHYCTIIAFLCSIGVVSEHSFLLKAFLGSLECQNWKRGTLFLHGSVSKVWLSVHPGGSVIGLRCFTMWSN